MESRIEITDKEINIADAHRFLNHEGCGAACVFVGTVRDFSQGKFVLKLEFEAYRNMALKLMEQLAEEAGMKWSLGKIVMIHVIGTREIGEPVVLIGTSSPHRDAAFRASRFLIDELKSRVPIWKKEYFEDESVWVNAHP